MRILNVKVGPPMDDYSAWVRKIKIANIIKSLGHEMDFVIYTGLSEFNKEILADVQFDYKIINVNKFNIYSKHFKLLNEGNYDIVFCNGQLTQAVLFLTKFKGVKFILDKHGDVGKELLLLNNGFKYTPSFLLWYALWGIIDILNRRFTDRISCVSHKMMEDLEKRGVKSSKLAYVTNGINLDLFQEPPTEFVHKMKDELGLTNKLVFTYLGACEKWQGVDGFIRAAKTFKNDKRLAFVIVGGKQTSKDNNIIYIPKVPQDEVVNYYAISDVLVLPRPSHPATEIAAPTKFPEYLAMGKPILTTNVGDAADLVRKYECGVVVEDDSLEIMVEGINRFKQTTANDMQVMGLNSKKLAEEEFSLEKMTQDLSKVLKS